MINPVASSPERLISFINRDHIVSVVVAGGEIIVNTDDGRMIRIPASNATIARFADDLSNNVQSNFVSIAHSLNS